jgi:WD40 repeat protein
VLWEANGLLNCRLLDATNAHLAAAGMGVRLWSLNPLGLLAEYPSESTPISALRFSPDGQQLAYASAVGEMFVRGVADGASRNWLGDPDGISSLCFSSDGTRILTGGRKGTLALWANEGEPRQLAVHHLSDSVDSLALAPSGDRLLVALGGGRQRIELYEIEDHGAN